jgi:hypothetical protein
MTKIKTLLKKIFYFGLKYQCVYCKSNIRTLLPNGLTHKILYELDVIGGKRREHAKCPICGSKDRERLFYFYYLKRILPLTKSTRIAMLHIAPEYHLSKILKANKNIDYKSGDKFESGYEGSYDSPFLDICKTGLPDNKFDVLMCNHVLEHVEDYTVALNEIKRILKPGGRTLLQVPISSI